MNYKLITNVEIEGIDPKDHPEFADAYIQSAEYDGKPMTEDQLDKINADSGFVHEQVLAYIH